MRYTQSKFFDNLTVSKRGIVKVASSQLPGDKVAVSKQDVKKVLKTFEKSPDVSKNTIDKYKQRVELDPNSQQVGKDFFEDLGKERKHKGQMAIATAMSYRQVGIFKVAGHDVYEDLETGDFWKMSEDKKHVLRLFKEDDKGISDKKASKEAANEYTDSADFTGDLEEVEDAVKKIQTIVKNPKWAAWLKLTDDNYDTKCEIANEEFLKGLSSFEILDQEIIKAK
jgi:hypothetical protein